MANEKTTIARKPRASEQRDDAPRYEALVESFIDNVLVPAGGSCTYWGVPGANLKPLNAAARANKAAADEVRRHPGFEGDSREDVAHQRAEALRELDNDLQDVAAADDDFEFTGGRQVSEPLNDKARAELERHALASVQATADAQADNTNAVKVQLSGSVNPQPGELQGSTPVLDAQGSKSKK